MLCHRYGYLVTRETFITKIYKDDIKRQFSGRFYLAATVQLKIGCLNKIAIFRMFAFKTYLLSSQMQL
jgi:hypothetical protein